VNRYHPLELCSLSQCRVAPESGPDSGNVTLSEARTFLSREIEEWFHPPPRHFVGTHEQLILVLLRRTARFFFFPRPPSVLFFVVALAPDTSDDFGHQRPRIMRACRCSPFL